MKKIISLIAGVAALVSCTNLEEKIYSNISKEAFFTSEEQFIKYAARAYSSLQAWGTEKSLWTFNIQITNEVCVPCNPNGKWWDDGRYYDVHVHSIASNNRLLEMAYNFCFDGITACNDVLDVFESVEKDFEGKDGLIAEIKVLRAYYYLCAIDGWGGVPYSVSKKEKTLPEKKDRAFMFAFLEKELTENIGKLQVEPTPAYYGRITRAAGDAILAKLYLNAEKWIGTPMWDKAEAACKDVMDLKTESGAPCYRLATNYADNFSVSNENCPEQIFAIPYSTVYTTDDHHAFVIFMSTLPADLCRPFGINADGWDGLVGEPDFLASYDPADTRKKDTWLYGQMYDKDGAALEYSEGIPYVIDPDMPEDVFGKNSRRDALQGARIGKWPYQSDGRLTGDDTSMENDFFLLRYADVVLMYVEALVRQGRTGEAAAVPEFQQIRTRAGLTPMTAAELTLDNLYWERAHELALEGWQRQDMIRFDKYLEAWWNKPAKAESDLTLPIPKTAIAANPNLK